MARWNELPQRPERGRTAVMSRAIEWKRRWRRERTRIAISAGKKSGDTREEEGVTADDRRPREEEGPSDLWDGVLWNAPSVEVQDSEMLHLHNSLGRIAAMRQMHMYY